MGRRGLDRAFWVNTWRKMGVRRFPAGAPGLTIFIANPLATLAPQRACAHEAPCANALDLVITRLAYPTRPGENHSIGR